MPRPDAPNNVVGILKSEGGKLLLYPSNKKGKSTGYNVKLSVNAKEGDIVFATSDYTVTKVLGREDTPGILSTISLYEQGLSDIFSQAALKQAKSLGTPELEGREDLRNIPLVTVDGKDSRDFDDAIFAEDTPDGGKHLIVAIADVSWYVRPGDAIDQEAYQRGNSTYFPDRAVPMLPQELSNGLCSLKPHEDRACMVYHLWIDKEGNLVNKKINRGLMRSAARLTYEQLQAAKDGNPDAMTAPLMDTVVKPLYAAHAILKAASDRRGMLNLEMPSYKAEVNDKGEIVTVAAEDDSASHDVIAQFMILANVAGDQALAEAGASAIHRYHSGSPERKAQALIEYLAKVGIELPADRVSDREALRDIIEEAKHMPDGGQAVIKAIAKAQAKAVYDADRNGHFGLALEQYGHHTSPIRRYSDLVNHRVLVTAFNLGAGGLDDAQAQNIQETAKHVTDTEIRSMHAESAADDRYAAKYLSTQTGKEFKGRITGVINGGVFVRINGIGAEGIVPVRFLGKDYYNFDDETRTLVGRNSKAVFKAGDEMTVRVKEANSFTGSVTFVPANDNKTQAPQQHNQTPRKNDRKDRGPKLRKDGPAKIVICKNIRP